MQLRFFKVKTLLNDAFKSIYDSWSQSEIDIASQPSVVSFYAQSTLKLKAMNVN